MGKIYVGQTATLRADTFQDATGATSIALKIKKPDGSIITRPAVAVVGLPTKIEWTATSSDLNLAGTYYVQAVVDFGGGAQPGETHALSVYGEFG